MLEDVSFDYQTREYLMQVKKVASTAELAAGVAHEIKNPLTIIQNYLELLKLSAAGNAESEYIGFIESELKRIVDIISNLLSDFYTTKLTRTNTGLGLSICQNITEAHGGVITFQSTPGQGMRFTVTLPAEV